MIKKLAILSLICLFFSKLLFAQVTGCYTPQTNSVHTGGPYGGVYANNTGNVPLVAGFCSWTPTTSGTSCKVCTGFVESQDPNNLGRCQISLTNSNLAPINIGYYGTFTMVACPLDDNLTGLILLSISAGIFLIRKSIFS